MSDCHKEKLELFKAFPLRVYYFSLVGGAGASPGATVQSLSALRDGHVSCSNCSLLIFLSFLFIFYFQFILVMLLWLNFSIPLWVNFLQAWI